MKRLFYVAFGVATILYSCKDSSERIVGKWNIVNITQSEKDTLTDLTIPLIVFSMQEEGINHVEFTKDNEYHVVNNENKIIETKKYSIKENSLNVQGEEEAGAMEVLFKQDDLVDIKSPNDIIVSLKRIEK